MSLHLSVRSSTHPLLVMGFEDGRVELWSSVPAQSELSGTNSAAGSSRAAGKNPHQSILWKLSWRGQGHNEAGESYRCATLNVLVMAMVVDKQTKMAFTVSADHLLCRYDLSLVSSTSALVLQLVLTFNLGFLLIFNHIRYFFFLSQTDRQRLTRSIIG